MLDTVRAARRLNQRIGRKAIIAGVSQGGKAALFVASLAPTYTRELQVRGTTRGVELEARNRDRPPFR